MSRVRRERIINQAWRYDGGHDFGRRRMALVLTLFVLHGLAWTALSAWVTRSIVIDGWVQYLVYTLLFFGMAMIGMFIGYASNGVPMSQTGFAIMGFGLGFSTGVSLSYHTAEEILPAIVATAALVALIGFIGSIIPRSLEGWWPYLMWATLLIIVAMLSTPQLVDLGADPAYLMSTWDLAIIGVFSLWVVYDMNRAMRDFDRTLRNASDAAADIYLDFLNLFLAIVDLIGDAGRELTSSYRGNQRQGSSESSESATTEPVGFFRSDSSSGGDGDGIVMALIKGIGHVIGGFFGFIFEMLGAVLGFIFEGIVFLLMLIPRGIMALIKAIDP